MKSKIKKGDKVKVLSGKEKGKSGKVLRVLSGRGSMVIEGVNLIKKHIRKRSESEPGGVKEIPAPIKVSKLSLVCPGCGQATRLGAKILEDKSKVRICKKCQKTI
ncbi:MAG: 50S ribosomal protein L24 [Candidatus Omnitrophota bacterium]